MSDQKIDFDTRVAQFVQLRDKIKELEDEHKEKMAPYKETLEKLNGVLLQHLNDVKADSIRTGSGTVYKTAKQSASIADMTAFWTYVVATGAWDLLDKKANKTAVAEYISQHNQLPPGINFSTQAVVGVRRK